MMGSLAQAQEPAMFDWELMPDHKARAIVRSALRSLRRTEGGPFSNREIQEIVADVMELPTFDNDISNWTKQQCRVLLVRLMVRGLIADPQM